MMIDEEGRQLRIKVAIEGPADSGKSCLLAQMFADVPATQGSIAHYPGARIEYRWMTLNLRGWRVTLDVYRASGGPAEIAAQLRSVAREGADAFIFVADSDPARGDALRESWSELAAATDVDEAVGVLVINQRDETSVLDLSLAEWPVVRCNALSGAGADQVRKTLTRLAIGASGLFSG
jgi:GTPase SAR1 family protein